MKRIIHCAAFYTCGCHWLMLGATLLMAFVSVDLGVAQSRDRGNPTRLTSNEISGLIGDNLGDSYYYSFVAGPGEVKVTLILEAGKGLLTVNAVGVELFNEDAIRIGAASVTGLGGETAQRILAVNFSRRQRVLLRINVPERNTVSAKYRVRLGGPVEVNRESMRAEETGGAGLATDLSDAEKPKKESSDCFPKTGTLIVRMKNGSKTIVDLSEAATVTIMP